MKMCLLALACALALAPSASATAGTVTLNQPSPHAGDTVSFTEVVPKDALVSSRKPQFPYNPQTQVDCSQNGVHVFEQVTTYVSKKNIGGGYFQLLTGDIVLGGPDWAAGVPAYCSVVVYSWAQKSGQLILTEWAWAEFDVAP